jgi:hypothetical protein
MLRVAQTVPIEVEYAVWKVSVRQIGEFFVDMFTNDIEDQISAAGIDPSTGVQIAGLPVSGQGHLSRVPLQTIDRRWAGEVGQFSGDAAVVNARAYAPYVSHAVWHLARMCYDLQIGEPLSGVPVGIGPGGSSGSRSDPALYGNPPQVGRLVKAATSSMMGVSTGSDLQPATTSLADWAERLSVVDNPNRTYWDYLKAFGVHPDRIPGMPEPVLMQRRILRPAGNPLAAWGSYPIADIPNVTGGKLTHAGIGGGLIDGAAVTTGAILGDFGGFQSFHAAIDETRGKRLMVDEPSFLIGTMCWWPFDFDPQSACHVMDATYLINSGTWGDPSGGSPDERDFLITKDVRRENPLAPSFDDTSIVNILQQKNDAGQLSNFAINMLNLYLNGDSFSNNGFTFGHHRTPIVPPTGTDLPEAIPGVPTFSQDVNIRVNTFGDVHIGVATDLTA